MPSRNKGYLYWEHGSYRAVAFDSPDTSTRNMVASVIYSYTREGFGFYVITNNWSATNIKVDSEQAGIELVTAMWALED